MSALFDFDEFQRWQKQAEYTIESAMRDFKHKDYAWCCFKCQQAGEYSIKALLRGYGVLAAGHSILKLLNQVKDIRIDVPEIIISKARDLDRHYIPPRYPDAYPAGSPFEFYDEQTAKEALKSAQQLILFSKGGIPNE